MAAENVNQAQLPFKGKVYAVVLGALIILLTTTVPYLTLLNILLFAGIFLSGEIALKRTILQFQVPLLSSEAFFLGCVAGIAGGFLSEIATFLLIQNFNYRPGVESLALVIRWALDMAQGKPELQPQVQALLAAQKLALAPVSLRFSDLVMNIAFSSAFYAPIAGLGGAFEVLRLKRKARRG